MKLIVGLGNPGSQYANTRHNCGFMVLDRFAENHGVDFKLNAKLKGEIGQITLNGEKAILLKPMTYMNLSGESVILVKNFYKIDVDDILVICDDLDSRLGRLRLRAKGSAGGHNGLKNIALHLSTEEYKRLKIGIDRDENISVVDWVLKKFSNDDMAIMNGAFDEAAKAVEDFVSGEDFMKVSSKYSSK